MNFLLGTGGGFLLAVLWMDLMFDVLVFRRDGRGSELSAQTLGEIAAYYRRVTTTASPMNYLVSLVMTAMVVVLIASVARGDASRLVDGASLALCGIPIGLALGRIFPNAVRLGARSGTTAEQSRLAREICFAHLVCFAAMIAFVALRWSAGN